MRKIFKNIDEEILKVVISGVLILLIILSLVITKYNENYELNKNLNNICQDFGYFKITDKYKCITRNHIYSIDTPNGDMYKIECDNEFIISGIFIDIYQARHCTSANKWGSCDDYEYNTQYDIKYDEQYSNIMCK